ncbi:GNAT family N-acetyltransferase [Deinococcus altitudinis]|uniref:GNAT family N-acetyltransferase n=1 Tax=Deinococcus altitudinis TaxID=468914 RepID=UPI003891498B
MIRVRQAVEGDVDGISRLYAAAWRDTYAGLHSAEYIGHVIARYADPERLQAEISEHPDWDGWMVAERDGVLLGVGGGGLTSPERWEIFVLYLDPDFRRLGTGTALVDEMTRQALGHGATEQWVSATQGNTKGLPFYEALGFVEQEKRESVFAATGEAIRTVRMRRFISRTTGQA